MTFIAVRDVTSPEASRLREDLASSGRLALDCEAAGFHRYSDRLCLIQVTTPADTYIVDPLACEPRELLRPALEDASTTVVMHGAAFDLRLLKRDLDIRLRGLFDTQVAATLLGIEGVGLASLLERYLGVKLSKKHQKADWAKRPLSDEMLEYAADDTRYLLALADRLVEELEAKGRLAWVEEECRALEASVYDAPEPGETVDPVTRIKGARDLAPRTVHALRTALEWRDEVARRLDRAPFRVVSDAPLVHAVLTGVRDPRDLKAVKGFPRRMADSPEGEDLVARLTAVDALPESELSGYPKRPRGGPGRPTPEEEALSDTIKAIRNRVAGELGIGRGALLSNAAILELARARPTREEELRAAGLREWQIELLGRPVLEAVRKADG